MKSVWSFNTTVRNPERVQNFLMSLKDFEGRVFDEECQKEFFALQIKKRLYKPTPRTLVDPVLIDEVGKKTAEEIPEDLLDKIIDRYSGSADASLRGRTTAGLLNRFGLCVASKSYGPVSITSLGKRWLKSEIDDQELFFRFLLKWQYPNPLERGYQNFDVKPFIATLSLIDEVNKKWSGKGENPVGITKKEFMLFVLSLTDYRDIEDFANRIVAFRLELRKRKGQERKEYENLFTENRVKEIFGDDSDVQKWIRNLKDYSDSVIKYFRVTEFVYLRGKSTHIDLSPNHKVEIEKLIQTDDASSQHISDLQTYLDYLVDTSLPALPWENEKDLSKMKDDMMKLVRSLADEVDRESLLEDVLESIKLLSLGKQLEKLENFKNDLQIERLRRFKYDKEKLDELIIRIPRVRSDRAKTVTARPSLDLEWFVSLSLMVLNDARRIFPSYKLGDDGIPTGFASNIADIECLYKSFGMIVEVTLLMGRDQWIAEGQPVMRHLRDFEDKNKSYGENLYCLFIAPYVHRDTLNTFWNAVKFGYEGKKQRIIPLSIEQYVEILNMISKSLKENRTPTHLKYQELLSNLCMSCSDIDNVYEWMNMFDSTIKKWGESL